MLNLVEVVNLKFLTFLLDNFLDAISPPSPRPLVVADVDRDFKMWNKLSGAFGRSRSSIEQENVDNTRIDVMSSVYEQHPNLSVFHTEDQPGPLLSSSLNPPQSLSRKSKTLFGRTSNDFNPENERPSSPFNLPSFPKKAKSTLHVKANCG